MGERATRDSEIAARARQWLLATSNATLCTRCSDEEMPDWPFGSLAPFALSETGAPIVLISEIAEHTRNLMKDPRVSLFVADPQAEGDPQASWRLTVMGRARRVRSRADTRTVVGTDEALVLEADAFRALHARYSARVPDAPRYFEAHRFGYWMIEPLRVRAIGGFGAIHWIDGDGILRDPQGGGIADASARIIEHMNDDHETALLDMCAATSPGFERPEGAKIVALDRAGALVETRAPDGLRYLDFGQEIHAVDARTVFVELTRRARAALASAANETSEATDAAEARSVTSNDLLGRADTLRIEHRGAVYTLRVTRHGRMILTK
jgi:putative heme iron utilization protein